MFLTYEIHCAAREVWDRIVAHYGIPEWHDEAPDLVPLWDPSDPSFGWHEDEEVGINFAVCETWEQAVQTMIHEYVHHLQELEADFVAERDAHLFLTEEEEAA